MRAKETIVSQFVVQRADFIVAIACVPCGPRRSLIYACAWGFWVCWKLSAAEQIKPDCCRTPAVVSILTDSAARVIVLLRSTTPLQLYHRFIDINYNRYSAFKTFLITVHWKQSVSCNAFASACIDDRETCSCWKVIVENAVVSVLSLTRLQLSGTNSLFLSAILPLSPLLNLPWKPFSF